MCLNFCDKFLGRKKTNLMPFDGLHLNFSVGQNIGCKCDVRFVLIGADEMKPTFLSPFSGSKCTRENG